MVGLLTMDRRDHSKISLLFPLHLHNPTGGWR